MKSRIAIALAAGIFALTAVAGPALAAEKKAEKTPDKKEEKKKTEDADKRIVDYKASLNTKFESSVIDNWIYEPGFQISHKNNKKASGNLVFKTNVTEYSKTDQKDKLNLSLEWKKKEGFGKFSLKFNHDNYSKNKAKTSSDFTFLLEKKHSDRHATEFTLGFSPDFYGGVGKADDEDDTDAADQCYDSFENEIAVDDAGNEVCTDNAGGVYGVVCGLTWWEYVYLQQVEDLVAGGTAQDVAEEEALDFADQVEIDTCAAANPTVPGSTRNINTLREIKGHTETYAVKHTVNFNKKTSADLQLKQKNIGLKGTLSAKDRTKDVDVFTIETGVDTKFGKSGTASLSYAFEKGESSLRNAGVAPDESYRQNKLGLKYSTKLSDPWKLAADFETTDKKYRTANDPGVDKNAGRNDDTIKYGINFSYKANDNFNYNLGYKRNEVDRNKLSGTTSTETDTYNFKVEYSF